MKKKVRKSKKSGFFFWAPRILAIVFILFISLFALDVFSMDYGLRDTLIALFMHLVPSFILAFVLVIACISEIIGGILFVILALWYTLTLWGRLILPVYFIMAGPAFVIGLLFIAHGILKKRKK